MTASLLRRLAALLLLCLPAPVLAALPVTVSVPPQAYVVEAIGGNRVDVSIMIEPGQSPHTFSLSPRRLMALDAARVYFKVGHPDLAFERRFLSHVEEQGRGVRIVDLSEGVELMALDEGHDHGHGHSHDHDHGETDPHLWVSPGIMRAAAKRVAEALIEVDPAGEGDYRERLERFIADVDELDEEIRSRLGDLDVKRFVVNHPAWGYFARDYDMTQVAIESGGRDPSPSELARFIDEAKAEGVQVIFVQEGFSERSARAIAQEIGATVHAADPLAADWLDNLRRMSEAIHEALGP